MSPFSAASSALTGEKPCSASSFQFGVPGSSLDGGSGGLKRGREITLGELCVGEGPQHAHVVRMGPASLFGHSESSVGLALREQRAHRHRNDRRVMGHGLEGLAGKSARVLVVACPELEAGPSRETVGGKGRV